MKQNAASCLTIIFKACTFSSADYTVVFRSIAPSGPWWGSCYVSNLKVSFPARDYVSLGPEPQPNTLGTQGRFSQV